MRPQGIDPAQLFSRFDIASRGKVIAAVSGGSDSTALLLLLKEHIDRSAFRTRLVAVTVDHALRRNSAREAEDVAVLCAGLGLAHRTLTWNGEKPRTGLAAAAREARHDLLAHAARMERADLVLTGHTADDQAETVLMRQARGEPDRQRRGLAGMAPATLFESEVWFARPLLSTRREALRAFLRERQVGWTEDPSNVDERYERPRLRRSLDEAGGDEAVAEALRIAADAVGQREAASRRAAALIRVHAECPAPGLLQLRPTFFTAADRETATYALRALLAVAGGIPQLPDEARTAGLLARLAADGAVRAVLSRALIDKRKGGVFLLREARGLPRGDMPGDGAVWDGRYRISAAPPKGDRGSPISGQASSQTAPEALVRLASAARPILPPGSTVVPLLAPWARYLPSFDVALAQALANLVGAPEISGPPFREHIESEL